MEAKGFQCRKNGSNVLFLLPAAGASKKAKTLLTLKMQVRTSGQSNTSGRQQQIRGQDIEGAAAVHPFTSRPPLPPLALQQQLQNMNQQNKYRICSLGRKGSRGQIDFEYMRELVQSEIYKDAAIFVDELIIRDLNDLQSLTDIAAICEQRIIWLAITYIDSENVSIEEVKSKLNNFYVPELVNPIRNSAEIVKYTYPSLKGELI